MIVWALIALNFAVIAASLIHDHYRRRLVIALVRLIHARATLSERGADDPKKTDHERVVLRSAAIGFREAAMEVENTLLKKPNL